MLFCLCSYSQSLTVRNSSVFTITVGASFETTSGNCLDGSGAIPSLARNTTGIIAGMFGASWTVVRAAIPSQTNTVEQESSSASNCGTNSQMD